MSTKDKNKSKTHFKQPRNDEVKSFFNSSCIIKFIVDDIVDTRVHVIPVLQSISLLCFSKEKPNNSNTLPRKLIILVIKYNLLSLKILSTNNILIVLYPV